VVAEPLSLKPKAVSAVSAGSAMACALFSGEADAVLAHFKTITAKNPKNYYLQNLLSDERIYPHYGMYRETLLNFVDASTLKRLHDGPDIRVVFARPPRWLGGRAGLVLGMAGYSLEKKLFEPLHAQAGRLLGFEAETVPVSACKTPEELADLIIASSCTPPFTPLLSRDGRPVLDGGVVDSVPVFAVDDLPGKTLVLLSRPYERPLPQTGERLYVQPSKKTPVSKWDYTRPDLLQQTYDLGRRDGEAFLQTRA